LKLVFIIISFAIGLYTVIPTLLVKFFSVGVHKKGKKSNAVALTFDDGPNPRFTPQLLDLLAAHQIKATFFVVGVNAEQYPEIIQRMNEEGHEIGVHNYKHTSNWLLNPFAYQQNLTKSIDIINGIIGKKPVFYRPPWGHFNLFTLFFRQNLKVIMWSHISQDWKVTSEMELYGKLKNVEKTGDFILLHDCGETLGADREAPAVMLDALERFIIDMKAKDVQFSTVASLLEMKNV
jgi:peptidoglycan/xylan/chitin deacetylase (PgdA/CDA1 family)